MHIAFKIASGVLGGMGLLATTAPILGEMFATMALIRTPKDFEAVKQVGVPYEEVSFPAHNGLTLRSWFFPADEPDAPAIIYAPSTNNDQISGLPLVKPLHQAGYQVLLFSYSGHGRSEGSRFGFTYGANESRELDAAVRYLYEGRGIRRIAVIGHSAGAVSAILSAARNPHIGAVLAIAPFTSMEDVWETNRPFIFPRFLSEFGMRVAEWRKGFSRHEIRPETMIARIAPRPLLLVFGSDDRFVRREQALRLYKAASAPKRLWMVEGAGHSQVRALVMEEYTPAVIAFLDEALGSPPRQAAALPSNIRSAALL